jgi:hypothetical protein
MFTCGVLDVFMENGVRFDGCAGISAGATFGCNYKSEQIGRAIRYNKKYGRDRRYCSLWSLIHTGDLYGADFCYRELPALRSGCIWMGINGDSPVRRRVIGEGNFLSRVRKNTGRTEKPLIFDARFSHNIPRQRGNSPKSSEI